MATSTPRTSFLPKQKDNSNVAAVVPGWEDRTSGGAEIIDTLAKDFEIPLKIEKSNSELRASIPDVWSAALICEMAFADKEHPMRDVVVGEWRGLLAMLALSKQLALPITVEVVQIPDDFSKCNNQFERLLFRSIPDQTLLPDDSWRTLYLLVWQDKPFAMLSPTTLVCAAVDTVNRLDPSKVRWYDGTSLADPLSTLDDIEVYSLLKWLRNLSSGLNEEWKRAIKPVQDALAKQGRSFNEQKDIKRHHRELKARLDTVLQDFIRDSEAVLAGEEFGEVILEPWYDFSQPLFKQLGLCATYDLHESDLEIATKTQSVSGKRLVIIDNGMPRGKDIATAFQRKESQIRISGGVMLSGKATAKKDLKDDKRFDVRDLSELFLSKLTVVKQDEMAGCLGPKMSNEVKHNGAKIVPIFPVNALLLDYVSPEEIHEAASFKQINDGVEFSFRFVFNSQKNGKNIEYVFQRAYIFERDIDIKPDFPVADVFPYLPPPSTVGSEWNWRLYYFSAVYPNGVQNSFFVNPIGRQQQRGENFVRSTEKYDLSNGRFHTIHELSDFPRTIACFSSSDMAAKEFLGLAFVQLPDPVAFRSDNSTVWTVGIDFGTDHTNVHIRKDTPGDQGAYFSVSDKYVHSLFFQKEDVNRVKWLYKRFVPAAHEPLPFMSVYHSHVRFTDAKNSALVHGNIYLMKQDHRDLQGEMIDNNLKWQEDPMSRHRMKAYLYQLVVHILAHAAAHRVRKVQWRFSYPSAMDRDTASQYWLNWRKKVFDEGLTKLTGISFEAPKFMTESLAAANYFDRAMDGQIVIDIGGGTTDIAFVVNNAPLFETSIRFAGRKLLIEALVNGHKEFTDKLIHFGGDEAQKEVERIGDNQYLKSVLLTSLLNEHEKTLFNETLPTYSSTVDFQRLANKLKFGISAIVFYLANALNSVDAFNQYKLDDRLLTIAFAGNGAKLLKWISLIINGVDDPEHSPFITHDLHGMFTQFSGKKNVTWKVTDVPKGEVVGGLSKESIHLKDAEPKEELKYYAGEVFTLDKVKKRPADLLSPSDFLITKRSIEIRGMQMTKKFLSLGEKIWGKTDSELVPDWSALEAEVNQTLSKPKEAKPLFFFPIEVLLNRF